MNTKPAVSALVAVAVLLGLAGPAASQDSQPSSQPASAPADKKDQKAWLEIIAFWTTQFGLGLGVAATRPADATMAFDVQRLDTGEALGTISVGAADRSLLKAISDDAGLAARGLMESRLLTLLKTKGLLEDKLFTSYSRKRPQSGERKPGDVYYTSVAYFPGSGERMKAGGVEWVQYIDLDTDTEKVGLKLKGGITLYANDGKTRLTIVRPDPDDASTLSLTGAEWDGRVMTAQVKDGLLVDGKKLLKEAKKKR